MTVCLISKNSLLSSIVSDGVESILRGFKFAIDRCQLLNGPDPVARSLPDRKFEFAPRTNGVDYSYSDDRYSFACLLYCLIVRRWEPSEEYPLVCAWGSEPYTSFRRVQTKHLVKVMFESCMPGRCVYASDFQGHPALMSVHQLADFLTRVRNFAQPVERRSFERVLKQGRRNMYPLLAGRTDDWIHFIPQANYRSMLLKNRKGHDPSHLIVVRDNRGKHQDEDLPEIRNVPGAVVEPFFRYWEKIFPYFTMYVFCVFVGHVMPGTKVPWCRHEELLAYFPSSVRFYALCVDMPIREDIPLPLTSGGDVWGLLDEVDSDTSSVNNWDADFRGG